MQFNPEKTIFIIDASNFLYRSYYGLPPLHTKDGEPVQAVFSFCRILKKLIDMYDPKYIALVWDSKGITKRHILYPEYKATRQSAPHDLYAQKNRIVEFANIIGIKQVSQEGVEADDLIAILTHKLTKEGYNIVILSSDKDLSQLLDHSVFLLDTFKNKITDQNSFEKKMGFPVSHLPLFYGLVGDNSDNIPGVTGIGEKTAQQLAKEYSSMEDLFNNINAIKPVRIQNALLQDKKNAFLSEQLFRFEIIDLNISLQEVSFNKENWVHAKPFFETMNFESLLNDFKKNVAHGENTSIIKKKKEFWNTHNFILIQTKKELESLCQNLKSAPFFVFDTETTGLNPLHTNLVGISVAYNNIEAFYIPCGHTSKEKQLTIEEILKLFAPIFHNDTIKKIAHNAKYDALVLSQYNITCNGLLLDTYIASQLVFDESIRSGLKSIVQYLFQEDMITYDEIVKEQKLKNFSEVSVEDARLYACADSYETFRLKEIVEQRLEMQQQNVIYYDIEHPLIEVLIAMERRGISCDTSQLASLSVAIKQELEKIESKITVITNDSTINLNSPQQIRKLLFEDLQLPPQKKSASGTYSTDIEVLELLKPLHPIPGLLIQHRELSKLKNTYVDALPTYINPRDNKIHTTFLQLKTATGRLASNNPNLQNIPAVHEGFGEGIRESFMPSPGYQFISADYSQIELRILAFLSQDRALVSAFLGNHDIHAETASRLFEVALDQVSHEQRQIGKRINFSILYGLTPYSLAKELKISFQEAKTYIKRYFEQYPDVSIWMDSVIKFAHEHGYVQTLWGRKRAIPNIHQKNKTLYEEARRIAINTVAQGTAADLVKKGMIAVYNWIKRNNQNTYLLLQIHDELLLETVSSETVKTSQTVKNILESITNWNVPLKVSVRNGNNWKEVSK